QNEAGIRRIEDIRGIETPLVSERIGACCRDLEHHVCPEAGGKIGWLRGNRWLAESVGKGSQKHSSSEEVDFCFHVNFPFVDYRRLRTLTGLGTHTSSAPRPALAHTNGNCIGF